MRQKFAVLVLGLVLVFSVVGCTQDKAPDVTPTPSPVTTPSAGPTPDSTHNG